MGAAPLTAEHAVGRLPGLKEPRLFPGPDGTIWLLWLEQRPQERGRTTALIRRFGDADAEPSELTPRPAICAAVCTTTAEACSHRVKTTC